jgi:phosphoglycolate phosphatase
MPHRAIVFDLDGTLLDTLEDLADSMNAVLAAAGYPTHPVAAYRHFVGDGVATLVRRALPAGAKGRDAGVAAMLQEYDRRWRAKTKPYPGVEILLDGLTARGLPFAILSNKPEDFTRLTTHALLGRWRFAAVWGVGPDVPPKPDPAGALALAAALRVPPAEILYVGDTNTDMETAVAAGMEPVGALWGFRDAAELAASGARVLVERPEDVLALL